MAFADKCNLHIPHKGYLLNTEDEKQQARQEQENYLEIERWAKKVVDGDCGGGGGCSEGFRGRCGPTTIATGGSIGWSTSAVTGYGVSGGQSIPEDYVTANVNAGATMPTFGYTSVLLPVGIWTLTLNCNMTQSGTAPTTGYCRAGIHVYNGTSLTGLPVENFSFTEVVAGVAYASVTTTRLFDSPTYVGVAGYNDMDQQVDMSGWFEGVGHTACSYTLGEFIC